MYITCRYEKCAKTFWVSAWAPRKYCNRKCAGMAKRTAIKAVCGYAGCSRMFIADRRTRKYCTADCAARARSSRPFFKEPFPTGATLEEKQAWMRRKYAHAIQRREEARARIVKRLEQRRMSEQAIETTNETDQRVPEVRV